MRKLTVICFVIILFNACNREPERQLPPNTYEVNIETKGVYNGIRTYLNTVDNRGREIPVDTAMVVNEQASFSGRIMEPQFILLTVDGVQGNIQFILEPGITDIEVYKDSIFKSEVSGSPLNEGHSKYKEAYISRAEEAKAVRQQANAIGRSADTTGYSDLYYKSIEMAQALKSFNYDYIDENASDEFTLLLLESMIVGGNQNLERFKKNFESVKQHLDKNPAYTNKQKRIESFIGQLEAVANVEIGKIAPDFSAPTPDGEMLSLSDIKGKATIIDFWASWCGPCRRENPNVVKVYNKYHDKGLEIISVSLDRPNQKDRWLDAIKKDKLTWHHVSNLMYFNDPVASLYNVNAIPATFILDENGRIVAKKLRGEALEIQIASMLE